MSTSSSSSGGIGLFGALGLLFVGLKLGHVIDWSWWWVTAPFWGPPAVFLSIAAVCLAGWGVFALAALCFGGGARPR